MFIRTFILLIWSPLFLFSQDIQNPGPVILPQPPTTQYIVENGQTVSIISGTGITLLPETHFKAGSDVTVKIATVVVPVPNNPSGDWNMNWLLSKSYDEDGNLLAETKSFFDNDGKQIQSQLKNLSAGHVLGNQLMYDAKDRVAGNSLTAPTNNASFAYKQDFIKNSAGGVYNYTNFDLTKTSNPDAVGNSAEGTLGWYYSNNNTREPSVPVTSYPYTRWDFYKDGTEYAKRSASPGDQLRMGMERETWGNSFPVINELNHYKTIRDKFFSATVVGESGELGGKSTQQYTIDENGIQTVTITDLSNKVLMRALASEGGWLSATNTRLLKNKANPTQMEFTDGFSFHYFRLYQPATVNFTGTGTRKIYNMSEDEQEITSFISGNSLPKGYYKAVVAGDAEATLSYSNHFSDISYSYYNQLGQLVASIAPNGVKAIIDNGLSSYTTLNEVPFVTTYEYDLQGRLIAQTETDAGKTEYIYRKDGNIRFSQNVLQKSSNKFSYTHYDRWGRPTESGEYLPATAIFGDLKTNEAILENTAPGGGLNGGTTAGWVKTYYDNVDNSHGLSGYLQDKFNLYGTVSHTENAHSHTWYNYDEQGRVTWIIKKLTGLNGAKTIDYSYNAQGNVSRVDYQKDTSGERFIQEYEYDADGHLKVAYSAISSATRKEQARYYYYLHGPLKRVELGGNLQGIDYTYTPQGWLKSINHPDKSKDPGKDGAGNSFAPDAFGMTLEYFNGDYTRTGTGISSIASGSNVLYYNGNIVAQSWRSQKPQVVINAYPESITPAMFTYEYDNKYQFNNNKFGSPNFTANTFTEAVNKNREYGLTYDANGNIKTLNRTNTVGSLQNEFAYQYEPNSNKLSSIDGYASYTYNDLGQMISKTDGVNSMYLDYEVGGKVAAIYSDIAKIQLKVSFVYDEGGNRIKKTDHIQNISTYYVYDGSGNVLAIYDNNGSALQQKELPVYASGRIATFNRQNGTYQYEVSDHLGNVRVVINEAKKANGEVDVVYATDYYPFGGEITYAENGYRYGYQGQYAEKDKESAWLNFALRMYDPVIGRWMTTDPYGQYDSPYVGMGNNPVNGVDPDGGFWQELGNWIKGHGWISNAGRDFAISNDGYLRDLQGDRLTGFASVYYKTVTEAGETVINIKPFNAVQDYTFNGLDVYIDYDFRVTAGLRLSALLKNIEGFDANIGSITLAHYNFVENKWKNIDMGEIEYSMGMEIAHAGYSVEVSMSMAAKDGILQELKPALAAGAYGMSIETAFDVIQKKIEGSIKVPGAKLGIGIVGEAVPALVIKQHKSLH